MASGLRERKPSTGAEGDDGSVRGSRSAVKPVESRFTKMTSSQAAKAQASAPAGTSGAQQRKISTSGALPPPAPKKAKSQSTPTTAHDEQNQAVIGARYWRTQCQLLDQRDKFKSERQELLAELEKIAKERADTKERTAGYKNIADAVTHYHAALSLVDTQMPGLNRLNEIGTELKARLERFTVALQQLMGSVMAVDPAAVVVPKTDVEAGMLAERVSELNRDLATLAQALGTKEPVDDGAADVAAAIGHMLHASELFFKALSHFEQNKALMKTVEELKVQEDFLKTYLRQLERHRELLR